MPVMMIMTIRLLLNKTYLMMTITSFLLLETYTYLLERGVVCVERVHGGHEAFDDPLPLLDALLRRPPQAALLHSLILRLIPSGDQRGVLIGQSLHPILQLIHALLQRGTDNDAQLMISLFGQLGL
jgi:hypothetical protein